MLSILISHISDSIKEKILSSPLEHVLLPQHFELTTRKHFKVAVIGAGMAGACTAYWLRLMGVDHVQIYEKSDAVGGRVKNFEFEGSNYELGASVMHDSNLLAVNFARLFNLETRPMISSQASRTLILGKDGTELFRSSGNSLIDLCKLVLRYGILTLIHFFVSVQLLLWQFERIYFLLHAGVSFSRPQDLIAALFSYSIDFLRSPKNSPTRFEAEIAAAGLNCNYGQTVMPEFAAAVSAAGMQSERLFCVRGGNFLVASNVLKSSGARLAFNSNVTGIRRAERGKISVTVNAVNHSFDAVVFAAPIEMSAVTVDGDSIAAHLPEHLRYHKTVVTFVKGVLKRKNVTAILSSDPAANIRSVGLQVPVDVDLGGAERLARHALRGNLSVWKIFSAEPPTDTEIEDIFDLVEAKKVAAFWDAYPNYEKNDIYPFVLAPGIFTTSAFERTASAIETALIAGKNVALLVRDHLLLK